MELSLGIYVVSVSRSWITRKWGRSVSTERVPRGVTPGSTSGVVSSTHLAHSTNLPKGVLTDDRVVDKTELKDDRVIGGK